MIERWGPIPRIGRAACLVALATIAVAVSASGSSDDSGTTAATSAAADTTEQAATSTPSTTASTESIAPDDSTLAQAYVGGKAGAADSSLDPVTIGWVNNEKAGPLQFPEATVAAQAAVKYINEELGGIGGHPLKLDVCVVAGAEEQGQECGQKFVNDPSVKGVLVGAFFVGNGSLYGVTTGKLPVLGSVSSAPADFGAKDAYFLYGSQPSVFGALSAFEVQENGVKTAAIINESEAGAASAAAAMKQGLEAQGVKVKQVAFPSSTTDLTGPIVASGAQTADLFVPMVIPPNCVRVVKALQTIKVNGEIASSTLCTDASVVQATGDFPKWTYSFFANPFDPSDPQVAQYQEAMKKYAGPNAVLGGYASIAFPQVLTAAKLLNEAGGADATPDTFRTAMKDFPGPLFMGPDTVKCGQKPFPSVCANQQRIATYLGDNKWDNYGFKQFEAPALKG